MMVSMTLCEPVLVNTLTGEQEDTCNIYPLCEEYGPGLHEILELRIVQDTLNATDRTTKPSFRETGCVQTILSSQTNLGDAVILTRRRNAKRLRISNAKSNVQGFSSFPREFHRPRNPSLWVALDLGVPKTSIGRPIMRTHINSPWPLTRQTYGSRGILQPTPNVPTAAS